MNKRIKTLKIALARITKLSEKLEDIVNWETENIGSGKEPLDYEDPVSGIGYGMSRREVDITKWIMEKSPGNWVFIIPDNTTNIEAKVKSKEFEEWLESKGYEEGYYILVVGSSPLSGDFDDPNWIVHDLIGHPTAVILDDVRMAYGLGKQWKDTSDIQKALQRIWELLPPPLQNSSDPSDKIYDICAGIVLNEITLEDALETIEDIDALDMEILKKKIRVIFIAAQSWLNRQSWFKVGKNKVAIVYSW
jgi:hypothetical protein